MRRRRKTTHKGPVRSKKKSIDGITFASGLEAFMWTSLKEAGIKAEYESEKFQLLDAFLLPNEVWERKANGKGGLIKHISQNIRGMRYTPDFIIRDPKTKKILIIIETKGRANEAFPLRWKLFKKLVATNYPGVYIFKPQKQAECTEVTIRIQEILKGKM